MTDLTLQTDPRFEEKIVTYPNAVRPALENIRSLILETAVELNLEFLEETLKWGEPSFLAKKGSTIRMDWKEKMPNQYALYFKCTSKLVPTFKTVFGKTFSYENNRALLFDLDAELPQKEVKQCIAAALQYHSVKHLPTLGITP